MGITKNEIFTEEQNQLALFAKVLGHPARIAILQELIKRDTCICGDLVNEIGLAQPTISQHLKELKTVGLIKGSIDGTKVCYCLNPSTIKEMKSVLSTLLNQLEKNTNSCC